MAGTHNWRQSRPANAQLRIRDPEQPLALQQRKTVPDRLRPSVLIEIAALGGDRTLVVFMIFFVEVLEDP